LPNKSKYEIIVRFKELELRRYYSNYQYRNNKEKIKLQSLLKDAVIYNTRDAKWLTGISNENLFRHIESTFYGSFNWENYGEWHFDHIIPCYFFKLNDLSEMKQCYNWKNLRCLSEQENKDKSYKLFHEEWDKSVSVPKNKLSGLEKSMMLYRLSILEHDLF
jgi:hypothetical protein